MARPHPATTIISRLIFQEVPSGPARSWSVLARRARTASRCRWNASVSELMAVLPILTCLTARAAFTISTSNSKFVSLVCCVAVQLPTLFTDPTRSRACASATERQVYELQERRCTPCMGATRTADPYEHQTHEPSQPIAARSLCAFDPGDRPHGSPRSHLRRSIGRAG